MRILLAEDEKALAKTIVKIYEKTIIQPMPFMTARRRLHISSPAVMTSPCSML